MLIRCALLLTALTWMVTPQIRAGDSGLNVFVIASQISTNSLQLANAYCELRGVPPQNVLSLTHQWSGTTNSCTEDEFQADLLAPLLDAIQRRGLTKQIDIVLLSMDLPYQVIGTNGVNSTTSALFYGFKPDTNPPVAGYSSCTLPDYSSNSYAFSESPFAEAMPDTATTNSYLAVMLTDTSLAGAELTLSRGAASDSTWPTQNVYLEKTSDPARNVRFFEFDNAIFNYRISGDSEIIRTNTDSTDFSGLFGLQTGLADPSLANNTFVPGGLGDTLTSFAGILFQPTGQTPLLAFVEAGAAGSYGTVVEPCNYLQKFPSPLDYFYQLRGFSLAEAYYQSLLNPYQGLIVGEPLAAPFARRAAASWNQLPTTDCIVSGQTNLQVTFNAVSTNYPLSKVDLFVDGNWFCTITNLAPSAGDSLGLDLNGVQATYTLPTNTTLACAALGLANSINSLSNASHVSAIEFGDRIELHLLNPNMPGTNASLSVATIARRPNQTTALFASRGNFLDSIAAGYRYVFVTNSPGIGDWIQLTVIKTNGNTLSLAVTNTVSGATIGQLVSDLINLVNHSASLQTSDGVTISDSTDYDPYGLDAADFYIYAGSAGWPAARLQVALTASTNLQILSAPGNFLDDNLSDLQPRNNVYVASGLAYLPVSYNLDTTLLADGYHALTLVAYEGTSVRTQVQISRNVMVQNSGLSAALNTLFGGSNTDLSAVMRFSVVANSNDVSSIELFTTGGSVGIVSNEASAFFSVAGTNLGLGLHPFYAVVTEANGKQFRTQTTWVRLIGQEPAFAVSASYPPLTLSWPATAGRGYDILSAPTLLGIYTVAATVIPSNSVATWITTNSLAPGFYQVRTSN